MTLFPHSHKSNHYCSDILQTKIYQTISFLIRPAFSLIFIIILFVCVTITAKITLAGDSIFNSAKKLYSINGTHDKLTQAIRLKKDIIYNDTLNKAAINFYYINNPSPDYTLYIKCIDKNISPKYIQFFDNTYKELDCCIQQKSSYLSIDMSSVLPDISGKKCIYITIGNASTSDDKSINILYEEKRVQQNQTKNSRTTKNSNSTNTTKKRTHKSASISTNAKSTKVSMSTHRTNHTTKRPAVTKKHTTNPASHPTNPKSSSFHGTRRTTTTSKPANSANTSQTSKHTKAKHTKHTKHTSTCINSNNTNRTPRCTKSKNTKHTTKSTSNTSPKINKIKRNVTVNQTKKQPNHTNKLYSVSLTNNYISLKQGDFTYLNATIHPANLRGCRHIWTTSSKNIATVSGGKVTGKKQGLAIIKVTIIHKKIRKTATCTIRIIK